MYNFEVSFLHSNGHRNIINVKADSHEHAESLVKAMPTCQSVNYVKKVGMYDYTN